MYKGKKEAYVLTNFPVQSYPIFISAWWLHSIWLTDNLGSHFCLHPYLQCIMHCVQMHADIGKKEIFTAYTFLHATNVMYTFTCASVFTAWCTVREKEHRQSLAPEGRHDPWSYSAAIPHLLILHNQHEHNCKPFPSITALGSNPRAWINPSLMKAGTNICTEFNQSM